MTTIKAGIGTEPYQIEIKSSTGNILIADEPVTKGGRNSGFSPTELLAAALGACTCATVRMYAEKKGWELPHVYVSVEMTEEKDNTIFKRELVLQGTLDTEQRHRLLNVAKACPIHKILSHQIEIITELAR